MLKVVSFLLLALKKLSVFVGRIKSTVATMFPYSKTLFGFVVIIRICIKSFDAIDATPSSGDAYSDRQVTLNFEL